MSPSVDDIRVENTSRPPAITSVILVIQITCISLLKLTLPLLDLPVVIGFC